MGRLAGRVAIVTGAAQGIGLGIARAFAREGADLALSDVELDALAQVEKEVSELGARVHSCECDVSRRADCERAVAEAVDAFGALNVLVTNAGWAKSTVPLLEVDDEQFERTLKVNTMGTFWMMQASHPHLVAAGGGSIINFASGSGTSGLPGEGPYAAAKEAIRGLSRVAANEWGPQHIRVNVICPFANSPGMVGWSQIDPKSYEAMVRRIPLRRVGDCEDDIGRTAVYLASDDSAYVTAQTLMVDGGMGSFR